MFNESKSHICIPLCCVCPRGPSSSLKCYTGLLIFLRSCNLVFYWLYLQITELLCILWPPTADHENSIKLLRISINPQNRLFAFCLSFLIFMRLNKVLSLRPGKPCFIATPRVGNDLWFPPVAPFCYSSAFTASLSYLWIMKTSKVMNLSIIKNWFVRDSDLSRCVFCLQQNQMNMYEEKKI